MSDTTHPQLPLKSASAFALGATADKQLSGEKRKLFERLLEGEGIGRDPSLLISRRADQAEWPLSFSQQRIWFLDQLEPGCHYNDRLDFRLSGKLDIAALERSLGEIFRRHEVLRAVFESESGRPRQRISEFRGFRLPIIDLTGESQRWYAAAEKAMAEARLSFNLAAGSLIRMTLYRLSDEDHLLAGSVHHIAIDGWSRAVFQRELVAFYTAFTSGGKPSLPELPIQYADYAAWQRKRLSEKIIERDLSYWRRQLADLPPEISLPLDKPRPVTPSFEGARHPIRLTKGLVEALRSLGGQSGCTFFMTLLAAFKVLLSRYSDQQDIVVGTPVANRSQPEVEELIGFFVNTLVLRTDLSGSPTFRELLGRIRQVAVGAYAHQELPFERLVEELQPQREQSRNPLFQVMVILQALPHLTVSLPGASLTPIDTHNGTSKFDVTLNLTETGEGVSGWVEYATDLFDAPTIECLAKHYRTLLEELVRAPDVPIDEVDLLSAADRRRLLIQWNDTSTGDVSVPVPRQFEDQVVRSPHAIALTQGKDHLTYAELNERVDRLASQVRALGVEPDQPVGILANRSVDTFVAVLAVLKAGGACVPLDAAYPTERLALILDDAQPTVVLTQPDLVDRLPHTQRYLSLTPCAEGNPTEGTPAQLSDPDHLAYVIFTSGSTGRPKGVAMTHRALANLITWQRDRSGLQPAARTLQFAPLSFDVAFQEMFSTWCSGGTLVLASDDERRDPNLLLELIERAAIERVFLPVVALHQLAEAAARQESYPTALREVITAGEQLRITSAVRQFCLRSACALHNHYGPSESHVVTTLSLDGDPKQWPLLPPIGRPVSNARIYLLDAHMSPVPAGLPGELYIAGDCLARGYLNQPGVTAERFLPDPYASNPGARMYRTGDVARYQPNAALKFLGRTDHQVKVRGYRVELAEIEAALASHATVREAIVVTREDRAGDRRLVAYIVPRGDNGFSLTVLRDFLSTKLPEYMVPSAFVPLPALPITPSGKVNRLALPPPGPDRPTLSSGFVAPGSPVEEAIARIWSERLGVAQIGVNDSFFELGGHSLLATQIMFRLSEVLRVDLPLRCLFETPTVSGLAATIEERRGRDRSPEQLPKLKPRPAERYAPFPLSDVQQAYWVGRTDSVELGNVSCHMYTEVDVADLDLDRFELALQRLIERHDMLRAIVLPDGHQQVLEHVPKYRVSVLDLRGASAEHVSCALDEIRERMSWQLLPSDRWPLFDVRTTRLGDRQFRLHLDFDLLIGDALSIHNLIAEFLNLYRNPDVALPPLELSFRDYILAEASLEQSEVYEQSRAYWLKRLATIPPAPDVPMAKSADSIERARFVRRTARLESPRWIRLKTRAARAGLTPSGVLLAVFAEVLTAWSKSPRYAINVTLFKRLPLHPQVNQLVGDFTSVTLLAVDHSEPGTFEARARRLQEQLWEDMDHRYFSGVRVLRELTRFQGAEPRAAMPVVFTSTLNLDALAQQTAELTRRRDVVAYGISQTPQVWLDHQIFEDAGDLVFNWDTVDDLFPEGLLDDMFEAYCRLLRSLVDEEDTWVTAERQQLTPLAQLRQRAIVNATKGPIQEGLLQTPFLEQAAARPDAVAVVAEGGTLTYRDLSRRAGHLGRLLRDHGSRPNELIAVVMEKGWEQVVAVLGVLEAGSAYLPIDANVPIERLTYLLEHGQVRFVLTQSWLDDSLQWPPNGQRFSVDLMPTGHEATLNPAQRPDDLAYVIFTSGSTGLPKGVMIDHRGALNTVMDINERFDVGPDDKVLALSSLSFDLSVYDIFGTLAAGGTVVLPNASATRDPAHWTDLLERERVTIWNSVPSLLELWLEHGVGQHSVAPLSLRLALLSGDWIPVGLPDRLRALVDAVRIVSLGGATEASIWSILHPIDRVDPHWRSIPYGRPMRNQTFHVLDAALDPRPVWVPGDLFIGGTGLAAGYWRAEERTAEQFIAHPRTGERLYRTGDLGRYLPNGDIEFLGREDSQVKINGYRVEFGEVEAALIQHPDVRSAVVTAVGERDRAKRLIAYVVADPSKSVSASDLRQFVSTKLPDYMVPSSVAFIDRVPLTSNGKVNRQVLLVPTEEATRAAQPYVPARTPTEEKIATIWADLLGVDRVGVHDNFFELGGDSLVGTRGIFRLRRTFEIDLPVRSLFDAPTAGELAVVIEEMILTEIGSLGSAETAAATTLDSFRAAETARVGPGLPG